MKRSFLIILTMFLVSCTNDSESDLLDNNTLEKVTYQQVKPIMDTHCVSCHGNVSPNAGLSLTNFTQVRNAVMNRGVIDRISRNNGDPLLMPQTGRLNQNLINLVNQWKNDGYLEE
jgi:hypothetical protein